MIKKVRVVEALDGYGDRVWNVEVKTTWRPWWRMVRYSWNKPQALEQARILSNPTIHEVSPCQT
jgi:hypothetical protein